MKTRLLLFILLIPLGLASQNIDSLKTVISQNTGETKVVALNELGNEYLQMSLDSSLMYIKEALILAESLQSKRQMAIINRSYGRVCYYMGQYDSSLYYTQEAARLFYQTNDTVGLCLSLNNLGIMYSVFGTFDSSLACHSRALEINLQIEDSTEISETYNNIGSIHLYQSQFDTARFFYFKALGYVHETEYSTRGSILNNIALAYSYEGDYEKSIETYLQSLKAYDQINDERTITLIYNNIGSIYQDFGFYNKAITYYQKKADYASKVGDNIEFAKSKQNIASCYALQGHTDSSLTVYMDLIPLFETFEDAETKALIYKGIADCLIELKKSKEAFTYLEKSLALRIPLNDPKGINRIYLSIAMAYSSLEEYTKALIYFTKCNSYLEESQDTDLLLSVRRGLAQAQYETGKYQFAYITLSNFVELNDSILSTNAQQQISDLETKYQTEKKEQQIALQDVELEKNKETNARIEAESAKKSAQRNLLLVGFALLLILAIFIFRGYRQKAQSNKIIAEKNSKLNQLITEVTTQRNEIEEQKIEIEEIHHEVSQSIDYAKRIQTSILPENSILQKNLSDHFVLFKPRDVVSGDFYWFTQIENQLFATVADCTGHGVPGAFMSMLGVSFLREIVNKSLVFEPSMILDQLRKEVIRTLKQKGASGEQKDGMDMALIRVDFDNLILNYSGANNPLYIISKTEPTVLSPDTKIKNLQLEDNLEWTLYEVKPDKMPIAIYEKMSVFTGHSIQLHKGDRVYMFSDGYVDQFGGVKGKKFMSKPFKRLLLENSHLNLEEQKALLNKTMADWMKNHQQIDDISIMGIEV